MIDGELDAALRHCERALAITPAFPDAHFNMNVLLRRVGRQEEAVERYWGLIETAVGRPLWPSSSSASLDITRLHTPTQSPPLAVGADSPPSGVSVVCVKWGTKYGAEYVNKLYAAIMRHADSVRTSIDFVCLTDDVRGIATAQQHANLRCLPLEPGWTGWWNKLQVFSPSVARQLRHDTCVFLDLDTVVVGSLAQLLSWRVPRGDVALLRTDSMANEQRTGGYNSSVMMWRGERNDATAPVPRFRLVYELLQSHFKTIHKFIYKFDHWLEVRKRLGSCCKAN